MKDLFTTRTFEEAVELLYKNYQLPGLESQRIRVRDSLDRVIAEGIVSPEDLPPFTRSTMDGYAVKAFDTQGASEQQPLYLNVIGEVKMGEQFNGELKDKEAIRISTGGMLPNGADAVVMVEYTELVDDSTVELVKGVASGENLVEMGEDIRLGDLVIDEGVRIRPQDIGAMLAVGLAEIKVFQRPKLGIISTGDELVEPEEKPEIGKIRDINSYTLEAAAKKAGAEVNLYGIVVDVSDKLEELLAASNDKNDVTLISGGSSVGTRDMTLDVLEKLAKRKVLVHGLSIKPGKPTLITIINGKPVFGLPGHPTAALTIYNQLVKPLVYRLSGERIRFSFMKERTVRAYIDRKVASVQGRLDFIRVKLTEDKGRIIATPIFGSSGLIQTLIKADGQVRIPLNKEGLNKNEQVLIELF